MRGGGARSSRFFLGRLISLGRFSLSVFGGDDIEVRRADFCEMVQRGLKALGRCGGIAPKLGDGLRPGFPGVTGEVIEFARAVKFVAGGESEFASGEVVVLSRRIPRIEPVARGSQSLLSGVGW